MTDSDLLLRIAHKAELRESLRIAAAGAIGQHQALSELLGRKAGVAGLSALIAERSALLDNADASRLARAARARAASDQRERSAPVVWRAWFDGSAHPNPGRCGIGAVLTGPDGVRIELSQDAGYGNSSEAEYRALIALLHAAVDAGAHALAVYGDSKVVIDDVNGLTAPAAQLAHYRAQAIALLAALPGVTLRWLPRHKNSAADALSQRAVEAAISADISTDKAAECVKLVG